MFTIKRIIIYFIIYYVIGLIFMVSWFYRLPYSKCSKHIKCLPQQGEICIPSPAGEEMDFCERDFYYEIKQVIENKRFWIYLFVWPHALINILLSTRRVML